MTMLRSDRPRTDPADHQGVADYLLAMSHELKAPLNAVIGMSGLLTDSELTFKQRQHAKSINAAGESLAIILNDLLDLSRILAGRLTIEPIPFDLRSTIEETAKALGPRAEERGLALRCDWRPEVPRHVVGDPGRTRQILGNLIGHAINASSQGEIVVRVAPEGDREDNLSLRFTVEDSGVGIPADRLDRVFFEYVPVDASPYRSFGVTGLGLRISAELVRLMGGDIGVESEVSRGSRFWFRLPLVQAPEPAEPLAVPLARPAQGGRILVVESDPAGRSRFQSQLEAAGWQVDFADELSQVKERLLEAHRLGSSYRTCIFSDYAVRPTHSEIAADLKAGDATAAVALLMVTAVGSPGEGKRLWHAGFAGYLRKPVPNEELRDALGALDRLGPDGRGPALITRHSLAEARNAQAAPDLDDLDAVLASLAAVDVLPVDLESLGAVIVSQPGSRSVDPNPAGATDPAELAGPELPAASDTVGDSAPPADATRVAQSQSDRSETDTEVPAAEVQRDHPESATGDEPTAATAPSLAQEHVEPVDLPAVESDADIESVPGLLGNRVAGTESPDGEVEPIDWSPVGADVEPVSSETGADQADLDLDLEPIRVPRAVETADAPPDQTTAAVVSPDQLELRDVGTVVEEPADAPTPQPAPSVKAPQLLAPPAVPTALLARVADATSVHRGELLAPGELPRPTLAPIAPAMMATAESVAPAVEPPARGTTPPESVEPAVVGDAILEQLRSGPSFFVQQLVSTFLREAPARIADLATAVSRGDGARWRQALQALGGMCGLIGATQMTTLCVLMERQLDQGDLEIAASQLGGVEHAFLEVRLAVEQAAAAGTAPLPQELPAVGAAFLAQLDPGNDPSARSLALRLAETFEAEAPLRVRELREAIHREDAPATQRLAQTLKGSCALISADPLAKLCALIEADARLKRVPNARRYLDQLDIELERVRSTLERARTR